MSLRDETCFLTPSYSIHSHSTASPRIPPVMHGATGAHCGLRDGFLPWNHPADTGAHSGARERQRGLEHDPAGESELKILLSAPTSSPSITRSTQKETSAGRVLEAALTSLEHMGLWMLPVSWQPGAGGAAGAPSGSGHSQAHHTSPAALLGASWHLWLLKNQRLYHSSQESQGMKAELPSCPHPCGAPRLG